MPRHPSRTDRQLFNQAPSNLPSPPRLSLDFSPPRPRTRIGAGGAPRPRRLRQYVLLPYPLLPFPATESRRRGSDRSRRQALAVAARFLFHIGFVGGGAEERSRPASCRRNFRLLTEKRLLEVKFARMADWANLQTDIVGTIIRKLAIPDYIRFRAVCTSWNRICVCPDVSNNPRVDPWLMLPTNTLEGAKFFSIPERKKETIRIWRTDRILGSLWTPFGSSHGWLLFFSPTQRTIQLVNPISGAQYQLPPVGRKHFSKAVLLDMSESNFSVAVIYGNQKGYEVTRKGSKSWSSVESKHILIDVFKHRRQLYTIDIYGTVEVWAEPPREWPDEDGPLVDPYMHHNLAPDEDGMLGDPYLYDNFPLLDPYLHDNLALDEDFPVVDPYMHDNLVPDEDGLLVDPNLHHNVAQRKFNCLVETPAGDLMKVKRQTQNKFAVWILNKGTSSFERTNDIGELALFVSHYSSLCLPAKGHPNLKANCLYFVDSYKNLCAFNLEHETKELVEALETPGPQNQQYTYSRWNSRVELFLWSIPSLK